MTTPSILITAQRRYSTKVFDPSKKISQEQINTLKEILRLSPSSVNIQPWHFIVATTQESKNLIAQACQGNQSYNAAKMLDASMVVVFCVKSEHSEADVELVVNQEHADGRYENETVKQERLALINSYINNLTADEKQVWLNKQCYIALGNVLLVAADMGIDSLPVEGFDKQVVDNNFNLAEKGLQSLVITCFGFKSENDFNADLPKSRLPAEQLFTDC